MWNLPRGFLIFLVLCVGVEIFGTSIWIFLLCIGILNSCFSPLLCCSDIAKCNPGLSITSLPRLLIVLMSTSSIVQFFAVGYPDWMCTWIVPCKLILLLLKHLSSPIDSLGSVFSWSRLQVDCVQFLCSWSFLGFLCLLASMFVCYLFLFKPKVLLFFVDFGQFFVCEFYKLYSQQFKFSYIISCIYHVDLGSIVLLSPSVHLLFLLRLCFSSLIKFVLMPVGYVFVVLTLYNLFVSFDACCTGGAGAFRICISWQCVLSFCTFCITHFLLGRCLSVLVKICCRIFGSLVFFLFVELRVLML